MLYNGQATWTAKTSLTDLIEPDLPEQLALATADPLSSARGAPLRRGRLEGTAQRCRRPVPAGEQPRSGRY
nr:hypothetical protein [uncultured Thiodictyon sp.]